MPSSNLSILCLEMVKWFQDSVNQMDQIGQRDKRQVCPQVLGGGAGYGPFAFIDLVQVARKLAKNCDLNIDFESGFNGQWVDVCSKSRYVPVAYTGESAKYQIAYQESQGGSWIDISCILFWGGRPAAAWPITLSKLDSKVCISSQGRGLFPPLFVADVNKSTQRKIIKLCIKFVAQFASHYNVKKIMFEDPFVDMLGLSEWNIQLSSLCLNCHVRHDFYLRIDGSIGAILKQFSQNLRYTIKQSQKLWRPQVICSQSLDANAIWREFRDLHFEVSGRVTRGDESWNLQLKAIHDGHAILVCLRDDSGRMIGGGYFTFSSNEALYAVAAYDRSLFHMPIGHFVQYLAIENFIQRGIKWYKVGNRPNLTAVPKPTEKELAIAKFKSQFASNILPCYEFDIAVEDLNWRVI